MSNSDAVWTERAHARAVRARISRQRTAESRRRYLREQALEQIGETAGAVGISAAPRCLDTDFLENCSVAVDSALASAPGFPDVMAQA